MNGRETKWRSRRKLLRATCRRAKWHWDECRRVTSARSNMNIVDCRAPQQSAIMIMNMFVMKRVRQFALTRVRRYNTVWFQVPAIDRKVRKVRNNFSSGQLWPFVAMAVMM